MTNFKTGGPWITRFAPSPTGVLHLGNVRTAILNFLLARQSGGRFLLRLEDTDQDRSTFAAEAAILWSLSWLGLAPDEPVRHQSLRRDLYTQAVQDLVNRNLAYPCFCTEEELEQDRQQAAANGLPPRYNGRCAHLSDADRAARIAAGEPHVIRFRCPDKDIAFRDLIKGDMTVPSSAFGDFVLLRSSGWPSYNLAVVVDDMDMGVNLVLRGEDHLTNTARQILLYEALDGSIPAFAHHGLLVDPDGKKLSKRTGALSIPECMDQDLSPLAVAQYLASLSGALPTKQIFESLADMAAAFNPFALGRGNAVMNIDELTALSARAFHATSAEALCTALHARLGEDHPWHGLDVELQTELVASLRENAADQTELITQLALFTDDVLRFTPSVLADLAASQPVLLALDQALSAHDGTVRLDRTAASSVLKQISQQAGVKGRQLYHPVRLALTALEAGPEMSALLTLIPVGRLRQRVQTVLSIFSQCNPKE